MKEIIIKVPTSMRFSRAYEVYFNNFLKSYIEIVGFSFNYEDKSINMELVVNTGDPEYFAEHLTNCLKIKGTSFTIWN